MLIDLTQFDYRLMTTDIRSLVHILNSSTIYEKPWQTQRMLGSFLGRSEFARVDMSPLNIQIRLRYHGHGRGRTCPPGVCDSHANDAPLMLSHVQRKIVAPAFSAQNVRRLYAPMFVDKVAEVSISPC